MILSSWVYSCIDFKRAHFSQSWHGFLFNLYFSLFNLKRKPIYWQSSSVKLWYLQNVTRKGETEDWIFSRTFRVFLPNYTRFPPNWVNSCSCASNSKVQSIKRALINRSTAWNWYILKAQWHVNQQEPSKNFCSKLYNYFPFNTG